jgi:hypothetical protein
MRRHDVQEALALHNISAAQRGRRVRNAGISIAYNVAVRPAAALLHAHSLTHASPSLQALKHP